MRAEAAEARVQLLEQQADNLRRQVALLEVRQWASPAARSAAAGSSTSSRAGHKNGGSAVQTGCMPAQGRHTPRLQCLWPIGAHGARQACHCHTAFSIPSWPSQGKKSALRARHPVPPAAPWQERVGRGEYNAATTRVLHFKYNPEAELAREARDARVAALESENSALRQHLQRLEAAQQARGMHSMGRGGEAGAGPHCRSHACLRSFFAGAPAAGAQPCPWRPNSAARWCIVRVRCDMLGLDPAAGLA